jgi:putative SOS response-associated peptidase YedK
MALGHSPAVRPQGEEPGPQRHEYPQCRLAAWRRWLELENRCVVPSSSFSDNEVLPDGMRSPVWLAFDESRPLAFFAGLWTCWSSVRKVKEGEMTNDLFAFLTTEPNADVKAIHRKVMPAILTTQAEINAWLTAESDAALPLQRPLPDGALMIVARGDRTGDPPGAALS